MLTVVVLKAWFQTCSIGITCELVRNAILWAPAQTYTLEESAPHSFCPLGDSNTYSKFLNIF